MDKRKKETIIKAIPGAWFSMAIILFPLKNSEEGKQSEDKIPLKGPGQIYR